MMKNNDIALRPSYWASVSGGKDSLFMLNFILHNLDKYPLDGVVHFELEIDYPFIKDVIDYMESECKRFGIPFVRIKPRQTWEELYEKYGYPHRVARWCNSKYKLDAKAQLNEFLNKQGFYAVCYIGYCADEEKRFAKRTSLQRVERYPLVEEQIYENSILEWAKTQPIFNNFYLTNRRCGCMGCAMSKMISWAYLLKYYPDKFDYFIDKMRKHEEKVSERKRRKWYMFGKGKYGVDYLENIVKTKWLKKLNEMEEKQDD